jgi:ParB-like chromosome segregation protein Spo0J
MRKSENSIRLIPSPVFPPLPDEEYEALKSDIAEHGPKDPILITSSFIIIDGHHIFRAVTELGIRKYPIRMIGNLSENERRALAISRNLLRRHLSRSERQHWLEELIRLSPQTSSRDLAAKADVSQSTAARAKRKVLGTESGDSIEVIGRNGRTYHYKPAVSVENLPSARNAAKLMNTLGTEAPEGGVTLRKLRKAAYDKKREDEANLPIMSTPANIVIEQGDFRSIDWSPWEGELALIIADLPWSNVYADLREPLAKLCSRLLRPNGVCLVYCGQVNLPAFMSTFCKHLDWVWPISCINEDGGGAIRAGGKIHTSSRLVLSYAKGVLKNSNILFDVVRMRYREKNLHPFQSPLSEAEYFVRTLSQPGELIGDFTLGSGTVPTAVVKVGQGRRFIGSEISPAYVRIACNRVAKTVSNGVQAQP